MKTVSSKELKTQWLEHQHERHEHPDDHRPRSTGLQDLDRILDGGIEFGQLVYVGGPQKAGKSTLLLHLTKALAKQKTNFIFFSAEMTNNQVGSMLFSNISGVPRSMIRQIGLNVEEWAALEMAGGDIEKWPGHWTEGFSTLADIDRVITEIEKTGVTVDALIGDYLQLVNVPGGGSNRVTDIETISRGLKQRTYGKTKPRMVIFATQMNRVSIRGGKYDANSFLGSGSQERDMDIGMIIHDVIDESTKRIVPNQKTISVVGSRETGVGELQVYYNPHTATLSDVIIRKTITANYWSN